MQAVSNCVTAPLVLPSTINVEPIKIQWDASLPIFAKEEFLRAVGDECGWLGGVDQSGSLRCVLPYTILRRAGLRMVRFRNEPIPRGDGLDVHEETIFLNSVVQHFRDTRADVIVPASNNAIFRTYPDGAEAAPYGTYAIDLQQPEHVLWANMSSKTRQHVRGALKSGIVIREGAEFLEPAYDLIRETFRRSKTPFMDRTAFERFVRGLGEHAKLLRAEHHGVVQSYCLFAFSSPCAYAIYAGNLLQQHGANELLEWEAIRLFRALGVRKFDYYGARISPQKGSKQDGINVHKIRMGAKLFEGYMWKYSIRPWRAWLYSVSVRMLRGGDIVGQEAHKLKDYTPKVKADVAPYQP